MSNTHKNQKILNQFNHYVIILVVAWTLIIGALSVWDYKQHISHYRELAIGEANVHFNWMTTFRSWVASHEGVYVPATDKTPPNEYLETDERDIKGPFGRAYTLMNPAYMTRQVFDSYGKSLGIIGHITSLKLLRPENAPDAWERSALEDFDRGIKEKLEVTNISGKPYLRLMRPLMTEESCLKCHAHQGYKVGDVRGGMSISVPMASFILQKREDGISRTFSYGLILLLGVMGIWIVSIRLRKQALEQVRVEKDLKISEQKMSAILKTIDEGVVVIDDDSRIQYINKAAQNIFGYSHEEVIGLHFSMLTPERHRKSHIAAMREYLAGRSSDFIGVRREFTALRKSGEQFPVEIIVEESMIGKNQRLFTASLRDVSEYKKIQESIIKKSQMIQLLQDIAVASNEAGTVDEAMLICLEKVCAHTGWEIGHVYIPEANGILRPTTLWREDNATRFEELHEETMKAIFQSGVGLAGRAHKSGRAVWITDFEKETNFPRAETAKAVGVKAAFAFPVREFEKVTAILEFFTLQSEEPDETLLDAIENMATQLGRVTERKRAEEEHSRLAIAVEQATDTIVITDATGTIQYVNPAFEKTFGYTRAEAIGQNPRILKSGTHNPKFYEELWATLTSGKVWNGRFTNKRKDGSLCEGDSTISPFIDSGGKIFGYVAVNRDVTKEAHFTNAKEYFAAVTAHELRTPMTTLGIVKTYLDSIESSSPDKAKYNRVKEAMESSYSHLERILSLTSLLSELNKPLMKTYFGPGFFNMVVTSQVDSTRAQVANANRKIDINLSCLSKVNMSP